MKLLIPLPNQPMTLSASLAVQPHCLRFAFAYSADLLERQSNGWYCSPHPNLPPPAGEGALFPPLLAGEGQGGGQRCRKEHGNLIARLIKMELPRLSRRAMQGEHWTGQGGGQCNLFDRRSWSNFRSNAYGSKPVIPCY